MSLAQKAIEQALKGQWNEAISTNLLILKDSPKDTETLNRLAHAYSEIGKLQLAREHAQKVLNLDPFNSIAQKCLEKWKSVKKATKNSSRSFVSSESFLEESGKTRIVNLINIGSQKVLAMLHPGEEVKIHCHTHKVSINSHDNKYVGKLPDDLAARLRMLIRGGNKYQALIKSIDSKEVTVFIRETEKGRESPDMPSFPTEKIDYVSFTPPELVHKERLENHPPEDSIED